MSNFPPGFPLGGQMLPTQEEIAKLMSQYQQQQQKVAMGAANYGNMPI